MSTRSQLDAPPRIRNRDSYREDRSGEPEGQNKVVLALMYFLGLGPLGFDRIVTGCYASGIAKLMLFIFSIVLLFVIPIVGIILLIGWGLWALIDTIVVLASLLTKQDGVPLFCKVRFDPAAQQPAFWIGIASMIITIIGYVILPIALVVNSNSSSYDSSYYYGEFLKGKSS